MKVSIALLRAVSQSQGQDSVGWLSRLMHAPECAVRRAAALEQVVAWSLREPRDLASLEMPWPADAVRMLLLDAPTPSPGFDDEGPFAPRPAHGWAAERRLIWNTLRQVLSLSAEDSVHRDRAWSELHMALIHRGSVSRSELAAPFLISLLKIVGGDHKADVLDLLGELLSCCGSPQHLAPHLVGRARLKSGSGDRVVDEFTWARWCTWHIITESAPTFLGFLRSQEARVRAVSAYPLRGCPGEDIDEALVDAFENEPHPMVQAAILDTLHARVARPPQGAASGPLPRALTIDPLMSGSRPRIVRWVALSATSWEALEDEVVLRAAVSLLVDLIGDPIGEDEVRAYLPAFLYDGYDSANTPDNLLCKLCCSDTLGAVPIVAEHIDDPACGEQLFEVLARAFFGGVWATEPQALSAPGEPSSDPGFGLLRYPELLSQRQRDILTAMARPQQPWGAYSEPGWLLRSLHLPTEPGELRALLDAEGPRITPLPFWDDPLEEGTLDARLLEARRRLRLASITPGAPAVLEALTHHDLVLIEARLGRALPEDFRRFVLTVAGGGPGPGQGLLPLTPQTWFHEPPRMLTPFDGESAVTIPLARYDDDHLARLVIGGFFHGTVWIEDRARSGELLPMACFDDLPGQERRPIRRHCAFLEWWLHDT